MTLDGNQLYLRIKEDKKSKEIGAAVVAEALEKAVDERIAQVVDRLVNNRPRGAPMPTLVDVLSVALTECCREQSTRIVRKVIVDRSKERVKLTEEEKRERERLRRLKRRGVPVDEEEEEEEDDSDDDGEEQEEGQAASNVNSDIPEDVLVLINELRNTNDRLRRKSRQVKQKKSQIDRIIAQ